MAGQGRALAGRLLEWGRPSLILPTRKGEKPYHEWFSRGAVRMLPGRKPLLYLGHGPDGGTPVGHVDNVYDSVLGPDVLLLVDDSAAGDAVLEEIDDDGSDIPLSMGFLDIPAATIRDNRTVPPSRQRTAVWLSEVAIVPASAIPQARIWARSTPERLQLALSGSSTWGRRR